MYVYEECRKLVFTEEGVNKLLAISNNIKTFTTSSGSCTIEKVIETVSGDSWLSLACIDFLKERGDIDITPRPGHPIQHSFITCSL